MLPLSHYCHGRDNNFNLIRVIAALLVLYSHCYPIALGREVSDPLGMWIGRSLGEIAVDIFFITSGFLVTQSLIHRQSVGNFMWARILRIFPGLLVAMLFCVFVVGLYFTTLPAVEFLSHSETLTYLKKNLTLIWGDRYFLPGVFESNIYPGAVNGSIWTLPWELKMYILLALIALIARGYKHWLIIVIAVIGTVGYLVDHLALFGGLETDPSKPRFIAFFFIGSLCYLYRNYIYLNRYLFISLCGAILFIAAFQLTSLFFVLYVLSLAFITLYLAYIPSGKIRSYNRLGDYSYGIYIYAFPIQQASVALIPGITVWEMLLIATPITLLLAIASWHAVEKPALRFKKGLGRKKKIITETT